MTCHIRSKAIPSRSDASVQQSELDSSPRVRLPRLRPRLLVSARSAAEVEVAIASGADIVDLKEPRAGALAPTGRELWHQVARRWDEMDQASQGTAIVGGTWRIA